MRFRGKGLGVITTEAISKGVYVTDYKYGKIHCSRSEKEREERDYKANGEGCYILEVFVGGKLRYLDATRRYQTVGR